MPVTDNSARMRMISTMIAGCPGSASSVTSFTVDAYLIAVGDVDLDVLKDACHSYLRPPARQFAPSASELAERCQIMAPSAAPDPRDVSDMRNVGRPGGMILVPQGTPLPAGYSTIGAMQADYGHGKINMRHMTPAEKRRVERDPALQRSLANKPNPELLLRDDPLLLEASQRPQIRSMR